jgi:hypothetical protein
MPTIWEDIFRRLVREVIKEIGPRDGPGRGPPARRGTRIIVLKPNDLRRRAPRYARLNVLLTAGTVEEAQRRDPTITQGFINWAIAQGYIRLAPGPARSGGRR